MNQSNDIDHLFKLLAATFTEEWPQFASCRGINDDRFFDPDREAECKQMCSGCSVRLDCLNSAIFYGDGGIRGQTNEKERSSISRRQQRYFPHYREDVLNVCHQM